MRKDFRNFIAKEIHIGKQNFIDYKNIMLCGDSKYIKYIGVSINNVIMNQKGENYAFHIFCDVIADIDLNKLRKITEMYGCPINVYLFDIQAIVDLNKVVNRESHVNVATLFRLIGFGVLPSDVMQILYIDSDILIDGDINELWSYNMSQTIALAVEDIGSITHKRRVNVKKYFNAGVMFLNIAYWNQLGLTEQTMDLLFNGSNWRFMDQDVLNIALDDKVKFIPPKYNYMYRLNYTTNTINLNDEIPVIWHFIGISKPWCEWTQDFEVVKKYNDIAKSSYWKNNTLTKIDNIDNLWVKYKVYQILCRGAKKNKQYLNYFIHLLQYFFFKVRYVLSKN